MSLAELLRAESSEYEFLAEWHGERAPLDDDHLFIRSEERFCTDRARALPFGAVSVSQPVRLVETEADDRR
ncbi:MAG TPA: hypothetical protein VJ744_00275 [Gaiellaceae bacterium]|nr:hypothetical protein [Gaiellaceae bacterium]